MDLDGETSAPGGMAAIAVAISSGRAIYQVPIKVPRYPRGAAIKTLLGVQLSFIAHCERKYTAAFGAKSSAGCPERNTGSGNSGIIDRPEPRVQLRDAK